jgi:hypothetical protein
MKGSIAAIRSATFIPQTNRVKHGSRSISRYYEGSFFFTGCDANGAMDATTARDHSNSILRIGQVSEG